MISAKGQGLIGSRCPFGARVRSQWCQRSAEQGGWPCPSSASTCACP